MLTRDSDEILTSTLSMSLVMEIGILAIREISISSRFKTSPDNCRGNLFYPWIRTAWGSWQSSCSADGDNQAIQWKTELLRPSKNYCFTPSLECNAIVIYICVQLLHEALTWRCSVNHHSPGGLSCRLSERRKHQQCARKNHYHWGK